jgi:hypothetical protein
MVEQRLDAGALAEQTTLLEHWSRAAQPARRFLAAPGAAGPAEALAVHHRAKLGSEAREVCTRPPDSRAAA